MSAANNVTVAFIKEISAWVDNAYDTNWTAILMKDISGDGGWRGPQDGGKKGCRRHAYSTGTSVFSLRDLHKR